MKNLRPNEQRAKTAITLIYIVLALEIASLISGYLQYNLLQNIGNGVEFSTETATANDTREQTIAVIYLIATVISAITFIQWFRRAYFNLHIRVNNLKHTEGWAAGSWFVPIISLYRPYQIMKELYYETRIFALRNGLRINENFSTAFLGWWWMFWILNNLISQFIFRYTMRAESLEQLINGTVASMIGNLIGIPLALITIKIIKDYTIFEPVLHKEVIGLDQTINESPQVFEIG